MERVEQDNLPVDDNLATLDIIKAKQQSQNRHLSGTCIADQGYPLASFCTEAEILDHWLLAIVSKANIIEQYGTVEKSYGCMACVFMSERGIRHITRMVRCRGLRRKLHLLAKVAQLCEE